MDVGQGLTAGLAFFSLVLAGQQFTLRQEAEKRLQFASIHETLVAPNVQKGRRLLYEYAGRMDELRDHPDDWDLVNHAVALLDVVGYYDAQGWLPSGVVKEVWGRPLRKSRQVITEYVLTREGTRRWPENVWPNLRRLLREV